MEREMSEDRKLCGLLNEMRLDGSLCDAVLRVDEVDFKVHKNILSAYSPYFSSSLVFFGYTVFILSSWKNIYIVIDFISF
ncbi:hypothetical protein Q7C36_005207 [Tachysurus vachellii]|uniref:BTB domain-containing protein n=1 Tax=Tachysurus vachellii TaxID=175792 RepID=A0AA88NLS4_TACVA|nr:hypothetical protein Q7C36_005207 [Tachysurus vachellii]